MSWRVCKVLDFEKYCTSIHGTEVGAKVETGRHLASLITKLEADLPKYAGVWNYPRVHPGFVEDLEQMIQTVGGLLQEDEVWGAYDEWHRFMNRWERVLATPLWVQVGTIIVDGPGPTVESVYEPSPGLTKRPGCHKIMNAQWEIRRAMQTYWQMIALDVFSALQKAGRTVHIEEIVDKVQQIAYSFDEDVRKPELIEHWMKLAYQETLQHYGLST